MAPALASLGSLPGGGGGGGSIPKTRETLPTKPSLCYHISVHNRTTKQSGNSSILARKEAIIDQTQT